MGIRKSGDYPASDHSLPPLAQSLFFTSWKMMSTASGLQPSTSTDGVR